VSLTTFHGTPDPRDTLTLVLTAPVNASAGEATVVEGTATADYLDLDNDEDPTNNTASITIAMP
jgi:hypothetical protein